MKKGYKQGRKVKKNPPIYVDSPNDPRLQAYNDSLAAYRYGEDSYNFGKQIYDDVRGPMNVDFRKSHDIVERGFSPHPYGTTNIMPISTYNEDYIRKPKSILDRVKSTVTGNNNQETYYLSNNFNDGYKTHWEDKGIMWQRFKEPEQPIEYREAVKKLPKKKIERLQNSNNQQSQPYQPQQVQIPPYTPVDRTQEWYGNSQGIPIDTENVQRMYNEDGTRKYKNGGKATIAPEDAAISNYLMQKNRGKNFVQRAYDPNQQSIQVSGEKGRSTHLMAYDPTSQRVYPEVVQQNGQLQYMPGDAAWNYADSTGEYISMPPSEKTMKMFSGYGYKHAAGMPMYKEGGKATIDNPVPRGVSAGSRSYQERLTPTPYVSDRDRQIEMLRRQQENTPAIGAQPTWQQEIYNRQAQNNPGLMGTIGYSVVAAAKLTDPNYRYTQGRTGYDAMVGAGEAMMDAEAVAAPLTGMRGRKPAPVQNYPTSPYRAPGGSQFPMDVVKGTRGKTGMPTQVDVPMLNKEQQILQSYGLDINKQYGGTINNKYANGGLAKNQWDTPYIPGAPGMVDYGDMYSAGNNQGLMFKPRDMNAGWEGYGNPANLITNTQNTDNMYKGTKRQLPSRQLAMDPSEYSIDAVRGQYGNGGFTQKKGMYWDGTSMKKAKPGAYDTMWEHGGEFVSTPVPQKMGRYGINLYQQGGQFTQVPVPQHMDRYGLNLYQKGGFVDVPLPQKMDRYGINLYGDGGIHIAKNKVGTFTRAAASRGQGVQEFASQVIANPGNYSEAMRKKAQFAHNAAGWKHQYGGSAKYETGGINLPSSGNSWGSSAMNTDEQMQDVYAPVQQANQQITPIAANQYRVPVSPERANMNEQPVQGAENLNNPYGATEQPEVATQPPQQPRRPMGQGYRDILGAAMIYGQYAANNRQNKNLQAYGIQQGMTSMNPTQTPFNKGVYNQQGQVTGMAQYGGQMGMGGKCYEAGGIYEVDNDMELEKLKKLGYTYKLI